jgi:pimeloyl-ACP methyl ester carboxylesterase
MTTFVLVHGAWHGGWCYKRVARLLRQAGHEVYTPTLTGLGERAHLMSRTIDLGTHVQDIVGVIHCEELSDVVLCGHSYGGMVIAGVAEQIAAKIRSLVYLDAFVPENGKSLFDYLPAEQSARMRTDAAQNGEGYKVTPIPATAFAVNAKDTVWVDAMCVSSSR